MAINLGNVVGLIKSETPPSKTYVLWGQILNPSFPDIVNLHYYDSVTEAWTPVTDPTTNYWLRPVLDNTIADPPASPTEGDRYLIPNTGATGAWSGKEDQVTTYKSGSWVFQLPKDGYIVSVRTEANKLYDFRGVYGSGGAWFVNDFQVPIAPGTYIPSTEKAAALGVATLDSATKVPQAQIDHANLVYAPASPTSWPSGLAKIGEALDFLMSLPGTVGNFTRVQVGINVAHTFTVGTVITLDNTGAFVGLTDPDNEKPIGIVSAVADSNNFTLVLSGLVTTLSSLTPGSIYYIQPDGSLDVALTPFPFLIAKSATEAFLLTVSGSGDTSGTLNDRGQWDASGNVFPDTGDNGTGAGGTPEKGNLWQISVAGTLGGTPVQPGDWIRALVDTPGQTAGNWAITDAGLGYVPEDSSNKENTTLDNNTTKYPTVNLVKVSIEAAKAYKGAINCSANPDYPAADSGHLYRVSHAGKIGGASGLDVKVGDVLICLADGTASGNQATVGAYWGIIQGQVTDSYPDLTIDETINANNHFFEMTNLDYFRLNFLGGNDFLVDDLGFVFENNYGKMAMLNLYGWFMNNDFGASFFTDTPNYRGGVKVIFIGDATTAPTSNPVGGILKWVKAVDGTSKIHHRDTDGNITIY